MRRLRLSGAEKERHEAERGCHVTEPTKFVRAGKVCKAYE